MVMMLPDQSGKAEELCQQLTLSHSNPAVHHVCSAMCVDVCSKGTHTFESPVLLLVQQDSRGSRGTHQLVEYYTRVFTILTVETWCKFL